MSKGLEIIKHRNGQIIELEMAFNEKNTFDLQGLEDLKSNLLALKEDSHIRVLLLSSASSSFFSNGLEPKLFLDKTKKEIESSIRLLIETSQIYFTFPTPTIAVINAHCMAAGAVFAIFSDYRLASKRSCRIGFPEVMVGLNFPAVPAMVLKDLVGYRACRDLLYKGNMIKSEDAFGLGLLDSLHSPEELKSAALKFAASLADLQPGSSRGVKTSLRDFYKTTSESLQEEDIINLTEVFASRDGQEGFRSILEGRRPKF